MSRSFVLTVLSPIFLVACLAACSTPPPGLDLKHPTALGAYLIEGMKFSMTGWRDIRLDIEAGAARDTAAFNVVLDESGLKH